MIRMYGFWRSSAAFRVRMALNLKGLAFEETMIDIDHGEQDSPAYRAVNPQPAVPALLIDGAPPLTQSLAILEYLDETHPQPPLLPADALGRARVRSLALLFAADHHPLIVPRIRRYLDQQLGVPEDARTAWIRHWLREGLEIAERRLSADPATGRFCHGDAPTIADLCLVSHAMAASGFGVAFADLQVTDGIIQACLALDAVATALPLRQPGAPASH